MQITSKSVFGTSTADHGTGVSNGTRGTYSNSITRLTLDRTSQDHTHAHMTSSFTQVRSAPVTEAASSNQALADYEGGTAQQAFHRQMAEVDEAQYRFAQNPIKPKPFKPKPARTGIDETRTPCDTSIAGQMDHVDSIMAARRRAG